MGSHRLALFGATTIPVGTGGGNAPDAGAAKTAPRRSWRGPRDDAMFAVNYMTAMVGVDFAYVNHGFTAARWRRPCCSSFASARSQRGRDRSFRTNSAVGLHLGYFIGSHFFSLGADLRYQRWLSSPDHRERDDRGACPVVRRQLAWSPSRRARACISGWASRPRSARASPSCADSTRVGSTRPCSRSRRPPCRLESLPETF